MPSTYYINSNNPTPTSNYTSWATAANWTSTVARMCSSGNWVFYSDLPIEKIHNSWYEKYKNLNYGAFITFVGIVRDENEIQGLSFDIYEPILNSWFSSWQEKAKKENAIVFMAHSIGDVKNHESSYIAGAIVTGKQIGRAHV